MNQFFVILKTLVLAIIISLYCNSQPAFAHRPHDVIDFLQVSPNYDRDKTVFIVVRDKFLRSLDGGSSWQTIVRGIDNKYDFSSLAIATKDPKIIFLSSDGDGIYKSQDGGNSWNKTNNNLDNLKISTVAISPQSTDIILALGTEGGLYQTIDGGKNWSEVMPKQDKLVAVGFSTDTPTKIAIADDRGDIYLSQNDGESWQKNASLPNDGLITNILFSPSFDRDKTFWVGTEKGGIYKTIDGGNSFSAINRGLADKNIRDLKLTFNTGKELELFASSWDEGYFKSEDGGETWQKYDKGLTKDSQADEPKFNLPHFTYLGISQHFDRDKTIFLAGFNGLFKSTDGGENWQELETLSTRVITSIAISPNYENDSTIAIGQYEQEGYISYDKGVTWKDITDGLDVPRKKDMNSLLSFTVDKPRFFKIAFSPNYNADQTIFASLIYRFVRSTDSGKNWQDGAIPSISQDVPREIMIAVSPDFANDKTVYLATYRGTILSSTNGGKKISVVGKIGHKIGYLSISPDFASDQTLYAAGKDIYKTTDGGKTWQIATKSLADKSGSWSQVVISPNYKIDRTAIAASAEGIFKTTNAGETWELLINSYGKNSPIEAIAISPNYKEDKTLIISVRGKGLFKTIDGGETFTASGKDLLAQNYALSSMVMSTSSPIQFSPAYAKDKTIYGFGSAQAELFKSTNGGDTWQVVSIPKNKNKIDDLMTDIKIVNLFLTVYPVLKFLLAAIVSFSLFLLLGFLQSRKKLPSPFNSPKIRIALSLLIFIIIPIVLFIH